MGLSPCRDGEVLQSLLSHILKKSLLVTCDGMERISHDPLDIIIERPFKKTIRHALTFSQLVYNQLLSPMRVVIEHANSGVKRLKIIKDIVRLPATQIRDKIMAIAVALHNFRVVSPLRKYEPSHVDKFIF